LAKSLGKLGDDASFPSDWSSAPRRTGETSRGVFELGADRGNNPKEF